VDEGAHRPTRLGDELRFLARLHPRETWATRPDLDELARFWLERHALFRKLDELIRSGTEKALDARTEPAELRPWLASHLRAFILQLDEHHQVEDLHYFPLFKEAEPRLLAGFDLLERDHETMHTGIEGIIERANALLGADSPDPGRFRSDLGRFLDAHTSLGRDLILHLDDEEDLVIPLIIEKG
jgi:iron-sulfur cluster repair protein YtfE (RIC family)